MRRPNRKSRSGDTGAAASSSFRYGFIDAIRGLAACLVMLQHSLYQSGLLGGPAGARLTGFIPNWLELGETGVVAFFIVSGFVIPLSLEKTANVSLFWLHRALRIYPLYIATFFLTFAITNGGDIRSFGAFWVDFGAHLLFIQEYIKQENFVGGSWTLSLEMIWYATISGLAVISLNRNNVMLVVASLVLSIAADTICALGHPLPMGRLSMLLCCVLGLICYRRDSGHITSKMFSVLSVALVCGIGLNLYCGFYLFPSAHPSATFTMVACSWSAAAIVFFLPFFTRKSAVWSLPLFGFLGRHSYSIYLLHPIILYLLASAHLASAPLIGATFLLTIGCAMLTYRFVEAPPIRMGHLLKAKRRTSARTVQEGEAPPPHLLTHTS